MTTSVQVAGKSAYDILQVEPGASLTVVRSAYRARVKEAHPDRGGSTERLREVKDAFAQIQQDPDRAAIRPPRRDGTGVLPRWRFYWQLTAAGALLVAAIVTVAWHVPTGASVVVWTVTAGLWLTSLVWYATGRMPPARLVAKVPKFWRR